MVAGNLWCGVSFIYRSSHHFGFSGLHMGDEAINVGINSLDGATATKHALQKTTQAFAAQIFPSVSFEFIIKHLEHLNTILSGFGLWSGSARWNPSWFEIKWKKFSKSLFLDFFKNHVCKLMAVPACWGFVLVCFCCKKCNKIKENIYRFFYINCHIEKDWRQELLCAAVAWATFHFHITGQGVFSIISLFWKCKKSHLLELK